MGGALNVAAGVWEPQEAIRQRRSKKAPFVQIEVFWARAICNFLSLDSMPIRKGLIRPRCHPFF